MIVVAWPSGAPIDRVRLRRPTITAALITALASPTYAAGANPGEWDQGFAELLHQQARVASVGYRLTTANRGLCDTLQPEAGWVVQDPTEYKPDMRSAAIRFFKMDSGYTVMLVVPDGPAARAGVLAGDAITAIDARPVVEPARAIAQQPASTARIDAFSAAMDAAMARGRTIVSVNRGGKTLDLALVPAIGCASRTDLSLAPGFDSYADGVAATITIDMVRYARDDDELAVVLGHETAHNVHHDHPAAGLRKGRIEAGAVGTRESEIEADYTDLYLMARAGYDYHKAADFWRRFGRDHGLGILASPSHPGWTRRARLAQATASEIDAKQASGAPLVPNLGLFDGIRKAPH